MAAGRTKKTAQKRAGARKKSAAAKTKKSPPRKSAKSAPKKAAKASAKSAAPKKSVTPAKARAPQKAAKKKYELKTKETAISVEAFLAKVDNPKRVEQARKATEILQRVTGEAPRMWGPSIVGFGKYSYVYDSGHSGEMCVTGFSPRKAQFVFYVLGHPPETDAVWRRLGKYKLGGSCLYVNKFEDIDLGVLEEIVTRSVAAMKAKYPD